MKDEVFVSMSVKELEEIIMSNVERAMKKVMAKEEGKNYLSRVDAAKFLGISLPTLKKYTDNGNLPHVRLGNKIMYIESEINNKLKS